MRSACGSTGKRPAHRIRQGAGVDNGKVERYGARLTLDVTPALRTRIKLAAFARGVTMAEMLREVLERQFPEATP